MVIFSENKSLMIKPIILDYGLSMINKIKLLELLDPAIKKSMEPSVKMELKSI